MMRLVAVSDVNHTCPCSDASLCKPLHPQPAPRKNEVFAFTARYGFANQPPFYNETGEEWRQYDWSKISAVVPFDSVVKEKDYFCHAKTNGVRVLAWAAASWSGRSCGVADLYGWFRSSDPQRLNKSAVDAWAASAADCLAAEGYDGVSLDMEGIGRSIGPPEDYDAITYGVCQLRAELNRTIPGALMTWTTDVGAYFDYKAMTDRTCVDIWLDMAYAWCITTEAHSMTRNRAQVPLPFVTGPGSIVDTYTNHFGVPADRLGIVFPWYGCSFKCSPQGAAATDGNFHGCPATTKFMEAPRVASMPAWHANATSAVYLNQSLMTKYFNFRDADDETSQVWYDDASTLAPKYRAAKEAGVRGVGMWTADCVGGDPAVASAMWAAVPALDEYV